MKFDPSMLSISVAAFAPLIALIVAIAIERRNRERRERPPQSEKLLRPPGYSLAIRLEDTIDKILRDILAACALSACAGASSLAVAQGLAVNPSPAFILMFAVLLAAFTFAGILAALRAFARMREVRSIRLGIRGEQAVAEALSEVADAGYRSFHDLPGGKNWNIDHVVAGARGVFLIETKARRRRAGRNGQPEHEVIYDGEFLHFPYFNDGRSVDQAKRNAKWLANYLGKKTGEPVRVEPLVVLPGWFVRNSEKGDFPVKVMNASYLAKYLRGQNESVEAAQVRRIVAALEEKCRDVEF